MRSAPALILAASPALADTWTQEVATAETPAALQALLDYHAAACTAQGGSLTIPDGAVGEAHLLGPETPALILDSSKLACSTAAAMFCGDGIGCELKFFQGEAQHSLIVLDWALVPDDDRQLLQVTIAGALLDKPGPGTFVMTWNPAINALIEFNRPD